MTRRRTRLALAALVIAALIAAAGAGAVALAGSDGQTTGKAQPTGVWAESDEFWTWSGAAWLHVATTPAGQSLGYVQSAPYLIDCPKSCTRPYTPGSVVTLTARPSRGAAFARWEGTACAGQAATCTFTIAADTVVTAVFSGSVQPAGFTITARAVTSSPPGVGCGFSVTCAAVYPAGTVLTLTLDFGCQYEIGPATYAPDPYTFTVTADRTLTAIAC